MPPEQKCPATKATRRLTIWLATATACFGSHASSPTCSFSVLPSTPPAALMSCTASSAPRRSCSPNEAYWPVIGPTTATLTSPAMASPGTPSPGTPSPGTPSAAPSAAAITGLTGGERVGAALLAQGVATAQATAMRIADQLGKIDTANADAYKANAETFGDSTMEILTSERAIGAAHPGASVATTEPVAHYLLVNANIADKTPQGFAEAVEQDTDPSPADLAAMLDLINTHQISALVYNPQTETAATNQISDAARRASIRAMRPQCGFWRSLGCSARGCCARSSRSGRPAATSRCSRCSPVTLARCARPPGEPDAASPGPEGRENRARCGAHLMSEG